MYQTMLVETDDNNHDDHVQPTLKREPISQMPYKDSKLSAR